MSVKMNRKQTVAKQISKDEQRKRLLSALAAMLSGDDETEETEESATYDETEETEESAAYDESHLPPSSPDRSPLPPADTTTDGQLDRQEERRLSWDIAEAPSMRKATGGVVQRGDAIPLAKGESPRICHTPLLDQHAAPVRIPNGVDKNGMKRYRQGKNYLTNTTKAAIFPIVQSVVRQTEMSDSAAERAGVKPLRMMLVDADGIPFGEPVAELTFGQSASGSYQLTGAVCIRLPVSDETGAGVLEFEAHQIYCGAKTFVRTTPANVKPTDTIQSSGKTLPGKRRSK